MSEIQRSLLSHLTRDRDSHRLRSRLTALGTTLALVSASFLVGLAPASAAPGDIQASTTAVDFGDVPVGSTATEMVTFTNISSSDVTVSVTGGAPTGGFSGTQACQAATLNPGESCDFTYTFTPTALGTATGAPSLTFNGAPFTINLTGTGTSVPPTDPEGPVEPVDPGDTSGTSGDGVNATSGGNGALASTGVDESRGLLGLSVLLLSAGALAVFGSRRGFAWHSRGL